MTDAASWPRRVGVIVNAWPVDDGEPSGTGRNAQYIATELSHRGIKVSVLVMTSSGRHWRSMPTTPPQPSGVDVQILDLYRPTYRSSYRSVLAETELRKWVNAMRPDVVHVIHPGESGVGGPSIVASMGVPVVMTACDAYYGCAMGHLVNPRERRPLCELPVATHECARCMSVGTGVDAAWMLPLAQERRAIAAVSMTAGPVVADSQFTERQIRAAFPEAAISLLSLPTPPVQDGPPPRSGPLALGYFGAPTWRKGLDLLLTAVEALPEVTLAIHGPTTTAYEGERSAELVERAASISNVEWKGPYLPTNAIERMRTVDVVVVPSRAESLPGVVKEALAAGRPVLGADVAGIPELVTTANGWLFEADSSAALTAAIRELARDVAATRRVVPNLAVTAEHYVDQLLTQYSNARTYVERPGLATRFERPAHRSDHSFLRRDERFQQGLLNLAGGRRRGAALILASVHLGAADRLWETLAWLVWWPVKFDRAFGRVEELHRAELGRLGRTQQVTSWLRRMIRP